MTGAYFMTDEELKRKKETVLSLMNDPMYSPMKIKDIAVFLDIPKVQREELQEVLDSLLDEGKIRISAKGKYGKPEVRTLVGIFCANIRGFGFVTVEDREEDVFIPAAKTGGAMQGDKVRISISGESRGMRAEGRVLEILTHANERVVGFYRKIRDHGLVLPDNQKLTRDIFIPSEKSMGAVTGHKVVVRITDFNNKGGKEPAGEVTEIIGHISDPGTDILSIVKAYELPENFPDEVLAQAQKIPSEVPKGKKTGRRDLRKVLMVTIDGEDAKDLDDAVSLTRDENGTWHLGVHIADVSEYVTENSPLDKEALNRSTSIYLVDRVIPMLPHKLSNGICSLNEKEDRQALSCLMDIDSRGNVIGHEICETLINVNRRMTYTKVNEIITAENTEKAKAEEDDYAELIPMLRDMKTLSELIRRKRSDRGCIDFDFPESKIILDDRGKPTDIHAYERNTATKLIEDFMLTANETVAQDYYWQQIPFLYRVHDNPDPEKMQALSVFIQNFGFNIRTKNGEVHPKEIQKLLKEIEGTDAEKMISRIALRSMKQARYSTECSAHFALAAKYYCHFTSPIRRYPDLQIHRIIKENLHGKLNAERTEHYKSILDNVADRTSALERRSDEVERETDKYKKCEYMEGCIGKIYEGVISSITSFGMYVELPNTVEGMIRLSDLKDDYYEYSEKTYELIGTMKNRHYRLGEKIRVEVVSSDRLSRTIDFLPVMQENGNDGQAGQETKKKRKEPGREDRKKPGKEDRKRPEKEDVKKTGKEYRKRPVKENGKRTEKEDRKRPEKEGRKRPEKEDRKRPEKEGRKRPEKEGRKRPEKEGRKRPEKEDRKRLQEAGAEDGKEQAEKEVKQWHRKKKKSN